MKFGFALGVFVLLTIAYISVLLYADFRGQVFRHIVDIGLLVAVICASSTCSFLLRFLRWKWLLARRGFETPVVAGCLSYFAGFALTALPGKLGELVRVRYFSLLGVPGTVVVGCFFFERLIDVGAVLLLACLVASAAPGFWVGAAFAATLMLIVVLVMRMKGTWSGAAAALSRRGFQTVARFVGGLGSAFSVTRSYFNHVETPIAFLFGLLAFGLQALGFVYISARLGFAAGWLDSIAIFRSQSCSAWHRWFQEELAQPRWRLS